MKLRPIHSIIVLVTMLGCTALFSLGQYRQAEDAVLEELQRALTATLEEHPSSIVTPDTIRDFRNHLRTPQLRDTAYLSLRAVRNSDDERLTKYTMQAHAGCSPLVLLAMSDQRGPLCMFAASLLWAICSVFWLRKHQKPLSMLFVGNLGYDATDDHFYTPQRQPIPFTPMQRSLLKLFFDRPDHTLLKVDICDALWPKKPDASDTLYTLVRRLKTVLHAHSDLDIDNERGQSYALKIRE